MQDAALSPDDLLKLDNQVCFALVTAARNVVGLYRPILEPLGLTHPQYLVMLALWERSPRSVKELADALQLDSATLSPLLKRLEASGHITRERSTEDERQLTVALTRSGKALRQKALAIPYAVVDRLGVEVGELESLRDALTGVIAAATRPADS